jgi:DNA modification methylase
MTTSPAKLAERIELWPLSDLIPYANNAREHSKDQVAKIAASISSFGFLNPLLVDRTSREIVAGHGRLEAARLLGLPRVPVVPLDHLSPDERHAYTIADNRLAELSTWNEPKLREELARLSVSMPKLPELGFDSGKLRRLLAPLRNGQADVAISRSIEDVKVATTRRGDVWLLGDHRLACIDSTNAEERKRALAGEVVDCVVTDPPYAIFGSSTGVGSDVADDRMVRDFFSAVVRAIAASLKIAGHAYVFCDWRSYPGWFECARGSGVAPANCIVWNKRAGLGTNWQNVHEFVLFAHRLDAKRSVWSKGSRGIRPVPKPNVLTINRAGVGGFESSESTTVDTVTEHNAAKPVELLVELVTASTDPAERVLDLFAGSGSTLIACELSKRRGVGLEIEPRWCDVSIERWERVAKSEARLEGDGRTFAEVRTERVAAARAGSRRRARKTPKAST